MELEEIDKMYELEDSHWWFSAKRELIVNIVNSLKPKKILDVGCGTGSLISSLSIQYDVVGCEYSSRALKLCKKRGVDDLVKSDAEKLPFGEENFDVVTVLDVVEHIDHDVEMLAEIRRILKRDGHVVISVPAHMFLWQAHDVLHHHKRWYAAAELKYKLRLSGFKILRMTYWNSLLFPFSAGYKFFSKGSNIKKHSSIVNYIFHSVLSLDNSVIRRGGNVPFGVSILCI